MFRSRFLWTAAVAVATVLSASTASKAAFVATYKIDANPLVTVTDNYRIVAGSSNAADQFFSDPNASGVQDMLYGRSNGDPEAQFAGRGSLQFSSNNTTSGQVSVNINGESNSPGSTFGMLTTNTVKVKNNSGATRTLVVTFTDDGFTAPGVGGAYLQQNLTAGSNGLMPGASAVVLTEALDVNGNVLATSGDPNNPNSPQAVVNGATVMGAYVPFTLSASQTPYQIRTTITITLAAGAEANFNTSAIVATPAPSGLVMLAGALPFAGLLRLRRRVAKPEATTAA